MPAAKTIPTYSFPAAANSVFPSGASLTAPLRRSDSGGDESGRCASRSAAAGAVLGGRAPFELQPNLMDVLLDLTGSLHRTLPQPLGYILQRLQQRPLLHLCAGPRAAP